MSKLGSSDNPLKVAIVGAGPSGFYAADALINSELKVEISFGKHFPPKPLMPSGPGTSTICGPKTSKGLNPISRTEL